VSYTNSCKIISDVSVGSRVVQNTIKDKNINFHRFVYQYILH
jgi:hypothetical protein